MTNSIYDNYVCENCFSPLEKCECNFAPLKLIQIDKNIQYAVKILNNKGYYTECCCEGHYTDSIKGGYIYVSFALRYAPNNCPNGWKISYGKNKYHPDVVIGYRIKVRNKDIEARKKNFEQKKLKAIEELNSWADSLGTN